MLGWETIIKSLNWTLILNVISFLLLVWLLRRILFKPLLRWLEGRRKLEEERIARAKALEAEAEAQEILRQAREEAREEARRILKEAEKAAAACQTHFPLDNEIQWIIVVVGGSKMDLHIVARSPVGSDAVRQ